MTTLTAQPTDQQLLDTWLELQDQQAFATLVKRHGPMIMSTARRVLGQSAGTEDVFQATFMVLAKKASSLDVSGDGGLGGWLHRVAYRCAQEKKRHSAIQSKHERKAANMIAQNSMFEEAEVAWSLEDSTLDDELNRLPDKYRLPLILCYYQGLSREEAASELGWSLPKIKGALARGREALRERLERRGVKAAVALGMIGPGLWLSREAQAAVSPSLISSTVSAAGQVGAGGVAGGLAGSGSYAIAKGVMKAMFITKVKIVSGASILASGLLIMSMMVGANAIETNSDNGVNEGIDYRAVNPTPETNFGSIQPMNTDDADALSFDDGEDNDHKDKKHEKKDKDAKKDKKEWKKHEKKDWDKKDWDEKDWDKWDKKDKDEVNDWEKNKEHEKEAWEKKKAEHKEWEEKKEWKEHKVERPSDAEIKKMTRMRVRLNVEGDQLVIRWSPGNRAPSDGVKVVFSKEHKNPVYPQDQFLAWVGGVGVREARVPLREVTCGKDLYIRVCAVKEGNHNEITMVSNVAKLPAITAKKYNTYMKRIKGKNFEPMSEEDVENNGGVAWDKKAHEKQEWAEKDHEKENWGEKDKGDWKKEWKNKDHDEKKWDVKDKDDWKKDWEDKDHEKKDWDKKSWDKKDKDDWKKDWEDKDHEKKDWDEDQEAAEDEEWLP